MPAHFQKLGIRFSYPENWMLDESEAVAERQQITVYSPGGSFWSVSLHPLDTNLDELIAAAVQALRDTYDDLDVETLTDDVGGRTLPGADVHFICLDLTNTALVRAFAANRRNCLVYCQADDREFDEIEPVFRAMTATLLAGAESPGSEK